MRNSQLHAVLSDIAEQLPSDMTIEDIAKEMPQGWWQLPNRIWVATHRCGCGECRYPRKDGKEASKEVPRVCPNKDSPSAIMLYRTEPRKADA